MSPHGWTLDHNELDMYATHTCGTELHLTPGQQLLDLLALVDDHFCPPVEPSTWGMSRKAREAMRA
jgi:hypothetical protein